MSLLVLASCATRPVPAYSPESGLWPGGELVRVSTGLLLGKSDRNDTIAWLGIPYAKPPVGELRWMAPLAPESWSGIRDASRFGSHAPQRAPLVRLVTGSEDCLYLNIWRPEGTETNLPVYVWIHGGANSTGAADAVAYYYGHALASKAKAIVVSVNYRLGVLGWYSHPALRSGDPAGDSGNFGTLDLEQALRWIAQNIRSFGGDPGSVTVAGESAGAFNILSLMVHPGTAGLFQRAVVQSGYRSRTSTQEAKDYAQVFARKLLVRRRIAEDEAKAAFLIDRYSDAWLADILRATPATELIALQADAGTGLPAFPYPIFDGTVLPSDGFEALADPARSMSLPLIIGTNKEEYKLFQWLDGKNWRDPLYQAQATFTSMDWKVEGADSIADAYLKGDPSRRVYLYRFDWGAPDASGKSVFGGTAGTRFGACHAMEIPFFLQTDSFVGAILPFRIFTRSNEKGRKELQTSIGEWLSAFIHTGDPNTGWNSGIAISRPEHPVLPIWEPWATASEAPSFMILDASKTASRIRVGYGRLNADLVLELLENTYQEPLRSRLRDIIMAQRKKTPGS